MANCFIETHRVRKRCLSIYCNVKAEIFVTRGHFNIMGLLKNDKPRNGARNKPGKENTILWPTALNDKKLPNIKSVHKRYPKQKWFIPFMAMVLGKL